MHIYPLCIISCFAILCFKQYSLVAAGNQKTGKIHLMLSNFFFFFLLTMKLWSFLMHNFFMWKGNSKYWKYDFGYDKKVHKSYSRLKVTKHIWKLTFLSFASFFLVEEKSATDFCRGNTLVSSVFFCWYMFSFSTHYQQFQIKMKPYKNLIFIRLLFIYLLLIFCFYESMLPNQISTINQKIYIVIIIHLFSFSQSSGTHWLLLACNC